MSHAARSIDPSYPSYHTGITFICVARRVPSFPTGYSIVLSSQANPAGAGLRWKGIIVKCMLAMLISSYVSNYVAPVSVHATWALTRARSELLVALLERVLHVVRSPFCVVIHAIGSLLAKLPRGVNSGIVLPHFSLRGANVAGSGDSHMHAFCASVVNRLDSAKSPLKVQTDLVRRRIARLLGEVCIFRLHLLAFLLILSCHLAPFAPALAAVNCASEDVGAVAEEAPLQIAGGVGLPVINEVLSFQLFGRLVLERDLQMEIAR